MSTISSLSGLRSTSLRPSMSDCLALTRSAFHLILRHGRFCHEDVQFFTMDSEHLKFLLVTGHTNFSRGDTQKELLWVHSDPLSGQYNEAESGRLSLGQVS